MIIDIYGEIDLALNMFYKFLWASTLLEKTAYPPHIFLLRSLNLNYIDILVLIMDPNYFKVLSVKCVNISAVFETQ